MGFAGFDGAHAEEAQGVISKDTQYSYREIYTIELCPHNSLILDINRWVDDIDEIDMTSP